MTGVSLCSPTGGLTGRETDESTQGKNSGGNMREKHGTKGGAKAILS